jgi:hypothetical protein
MGTLFKNVFPPDVVQALILLGAWGDSPPGYIVSGHALRVGAEMGLHKAFSKLMLTGMGKNRTAAEVEEERTLVETARLWFSVSSWE